MNLKRLGNWVPWHIRGRSSEVTMSVTFEKQEDIIRALAFYDSSGDVGFPV